MYFFKRAFSKLCKRFSLFDKLMMFPSIKFEYFIRQFKNVQTSMMLQLKLDTEFQKLFNISF